MNELRKYTLGSGHLHIEEYTGEMPYGTDDHSWNEFFSNDDGSVRENNLLGRIKSGAAFEYSTEKYEDEDDLGYVKISEITKEKVTLKSGVMTWNPAVIEKLCTTASVSENDGIITLELGGLGNQNDRRYILGFEHKNRDLRVIIVGHNTEGFNFDFKQDSATVIDCVFTAEAYNNQGRLLLIQDMRNRPLLSGLTIGGLTLSPAFDPSVKTYTASTTQASGKVTATAKNSGDTVTIKNGNTAVTNGQNAAWSAGSNTLTVKVTNTAGSEATYTVTVTKSGD